jgi:peptidoglycan DL-endopeptidase CwlO
VAGLQRKLYGTMAWCMVVGIIASCGNDQHSPNTVRGTDKYMARGATDARLIEPAITDHDVLLVVGDMNVEHFLQTGQSRETGNSRAGGPYTMSGQGMTQVYPNPAIPPMAGGYVENVIAMASLFMGWPYEYGSDRSDTSTFDCSDFTRYSYLAALGMDIPSDSRSQARYIERFSNRVYWNPREAKRGDLLFFIGYRGGDPDNYADADKSISSISHVGISLGDGRMIHTASEATGGVRIDPIVDNHLEYRFVLGGTVLDWK